jgi:hypothetical protein
MTAICTRFKPVRRAFCVETKRKRNIINWTHSYVGIQLLCPPQWSHDFNPLAPEFCFLILAHPVCKMWIIQEPKNLAVSNKSRVCSMFKIFSTYICWINIYKMQHLEVSGAVRPIYMSLGVKGLTAERTQQWLAQISQYNKNFYHQNEGENTLN